MEFFFLQNYFWKKGYSFFVLMMSANFTPMMEFIIDGYIKKKAYLGGQKKLAGCDLSWQKCFHRKMYFLAGDLYTSTLPVVMQTAKFIEHD
jgi:hypothetical protein